MHTYAPSPFHEVVVSLLQQVSLLAIVGAKINKIFEGNLNCLIVIEFSIMQEPFCHRQCKNLITV